MATHTLPSDTELDHLYGHLTRSPALTAVAHWSPYGDRFRTKQDTSTDVFPDLDPFETLDAAFKRAAHVVFSNR